jgi:hypothetical protein
MIFFYASVIRSTKPIDCDFMKEFPQIKIYQHERFLIVVYFNPPNTMYFIYDSSFLPNKSYII